MPKRHSYIGEGSVGLSAKHGQPVYYASGQAPASGVMRANGAALARANYPNCYDIVPGDNPASVTSSWSRNWSLNQGYGLAVGATSVLFSATDETGSPYHGWAAYLNPTTGVIGSPFGSPDRTFGKPDGYGYYSAWSPDLSRYFSVPYDAGGNGGLLAMFNEAGAGWAQTTAVPVSPQAVFCTPTQLVLFSGATFYTTPISGFTNTSGANTQAWTTNGQSGNLPGLTDIDYDYATNTWMAVCQSGATITVKKSTDMSTWTTVATLTMQNTTATYIQCSNGEWFVWQNGFIQAVYHSADGGATWPVLFTPTTTLNLLVVSPGATGYLYINMSMGCATSVPAGTAPTFGAAIVSGTPPDPRCGQKARWCSWAGVVCGVTSNGSSLVGWAVAASANFTAPTLPSFNGYDAYIKV